MSARGRMSRPNGSPEDSILDKTDDYTSRAQEFQEEYFHKDAIVRVIECLRESRRKVHPLLVGRDGCGRKFIALGVAKQLTDSADPVNEKIRIRACTQALLQEDTRYRGQDRDKLLKLVKEVEQSKMREILFLDNIHLTVGAGATMEDVQGDLSSGLMEFLTEQGPLQIIGGTTPDGYHFMQARNETFTSRFTPIDIEDLSEDLSVALLRNYVEAYEPDWKGAFSEDLYRRIFHYGQRLLPHRAPPGCGVDLLREMLNEKFLKSGSGTTRKTVKDGESWLFRAITQRTGMRRCMFDEKEPLTREQVEEAFRKDYFGQDEAVRAACQVILRRKANLSPPDRPSGVFLLVGPTGVGKTELGRCMARYLYGDVKKMKIVDMAEFCDTGAIDVLRQRIVSQFSADPYTLLLLDEIEKASATVHHVLLAAIGDGRLTDAGGRTADLRQAIILMTSNVGSTLYLEGTQPAHQGLMGELRKAFAPEFLNRVEHIMFLKPLPPEVRRKIADKELRLALKGRVGIQFRNLQVEWSEEVVNWIAEQGFDPEFGARSLQRAIEREIVFPLSEKIAAGEIRAGARVLLEVATDRIETRIG